MVYIRTPLYLVRAARFVGASSISEQGAKCSMIIVYMKVRRFLLSARGSSVASRRARMVAARALVIPLTCQSAGPTVLAKAPVPPCPLSRQWRACSRLWQAARARRRPRNNKTRTDYQCWQQVYFKTYAAVFCTEYLASQIDR